MPPRSIFCYASQLFAASEIGMSLRIAFINSERNHCPTIPVGHDRSRRGKADTFCFNFIFNREVV